MRKTKMTAILLALALVAGMLLTACKSNTPEAQVKKDIKDFKKSTELGNSFDTYSIEADTDTTENAKKFFEKVKDFDYDIEKTEMSDNDEKAVVTVSITTYDFGTAYLEVWDSLVSNNSVSTDTNELYSRLFKKLSSVDRKDYTKSVKINCAKDADGNWETDLSSNTDFVNAVYGGMMDVVNEIAKISQ